MPHSKTTLAKLLKELDFGSSVAEQDDLLESARVETSVFSDLMNDRIDLVPGTKGSGKSALYRMFADFLPNLLIRNRRVVVAHGIRHQGDNVFHAFKEHFDSLSENQFVGFWSVYLVSLAHEQFIKSERYADALKGHDRLIKAFKASCADAQIPDIPKPLNLKGVLEWTLNVIRKWRPKVTMVDPQSGSKFTADMFAATGDDSHKDEDRTAIEQLPQHVNAVVECLEALLETADLNLWLLVDRLDEIFPRRSDTETRALRGLLRVLRVFDSKRIRVKIFLRDDILDQIVSGSEGFTALTHITARQADTLKWSEPQLLTVIVRRIGAHEPLREFLNVEPELLEASQEYREKVFYKIFPPTVHSGERQSSTMRWIFNHCIDGRGVATPRDVIDLLTRARQKQLDEFTSDNSGTAEFLIGSAAIQYGAAELSRRKRTTLLEAEFPHLWTYIKQLIGGRTEYTLKAAEQLWGVKYKEVIEDLVSIGVVARSTRKGEDTIKVPYVYRTGLELTQGAVEE